MKGKEGGICKKHLNSQQGAITQSLPIYMVIGEIPKTVPLFFGPCS